MTPTCPFCGATPRAIRGMYVRIPPPPYAWCEACGASGPRRDTEAAALEEFTSLSRARRIGEAALDAVRKHDEEHENAFGLDAIADDIEADTNYMPHVEGARILRAVADAIRETL